MRSHFKALSTNSPCILFTMFFILSKFILNQDILLSNRRVFRRRKKKLLLATLLEAQNYSTILSKYNRCLGHKRQIQPPKTKTQKKTKEGGISKVCKRIQCKCFFILNISKDELESPHLLSTPGFSQTLKSSNTGASGGVIYWQTRHTYKEINMHSQKTGSNIKTETIQLYETTRYFPIFLPPHWGGELGDNEQYSYTYTYIYFFLLKNKTKKTCEKIYSYVSYR